MSRDCTLYISTHVFFDTMIQIIIGLIIWLALPHFFAGRIKRKGDRQAMGMLCKIIGGAIVGWGIVSLIINLVNQATQ